MNLCDPKELKSLLSRHDFRNARSLGQNFLINPTVPERMVSLSNIDKTCGVVEIGPGVGALSVELARAAGRVVSVEIDRRLEPVLGETLQGFDNIRVVFADAMKTDLKKLAEEHLGGLRLFACANLPYYITTPVIVRLLESRIFEAVTVMVQREAAERFCAKPGDKNYVAVTAQVNFYAKPEILFDISPNSFLPPPHVISSVLRFSVCKKPPVETCDEAFLFEVIRLSFANRRKTLLNALSMGLRIGKDELGRVLGEADIDGSVRGERLSLEQFCRISNGLWHYNAKIRPRE